MKGMLFKPDMIQAIVEGRKTRFTEVIEPQPKRYQVHITHSPRRFSWTTDDMVELKDGSLAMVNAPAGLHLARYQVGETVYIKEKTLCWDGGAGGCSNVVYQDDPDIPQLLEDNNRLLVPRETANILAGEPVVGKWRWRAPWFMPQEDARYFLKILAVRAERLQEISYNEEEAAREGVMAHEDRCSYVAEFIDLWNSINPKYPFDSNPWVWVYGFEFAGTQPREAT